MGVVNESMVLAIIYDGHDPLPYLLYADWLDEHEQDGGWLRAPHGLDLYLRVLRRHQRTCYQSLAEGAPKLARSIFISPDCYQWLMMEGGRRMDHLGLDIAAAFDRLGVMGFRVEVDRRGRKMKSHGQGLANIVRQVRAPRAADLKGQSAVPAETVGVDAEQSS